jgi:hypothetical protein
MMLAIFLTLMHAVSLILYETLDVTIHNQYPDIELASPICFYDGGISNEYSIEWIDDATVRTSFKSHLEFIPGQNKPRGILVYEVQRKGNTTSEVVKNTSKIMRLLVAWKIFSWVAPQVNIMLVEHDNELILDEDELMQLYDKIDDPFSRYYDEPFQSIQLVYENTVLDVIYEATHKEGLELKITISEKVEGENTELAPWIKEERQVSLMMPYFVLIHIVRKVNTLISVFLHPE